MHTTVKPTLQCFRCGYQWTPRGDVEPARIKSCPDCKHRKWNLRDWQPYTRDPDEPRYKTEKPILKPELVKTEKPTQDLGGSREYDQYRKAANRRLDEALKRDKKPMTKEQSEKYTEEADAFWGNPALTEKPIPEPRPEPCHDCGEDGEYSIEATDLNFTDQGTELITYQEWFCGDCYQKRTKNLP